MEILLYQFEIQVIKITSKNKMLNSSRHKSTVNIIKSK